MTADMDDDQLIANVRAVAANNAAARDPERSPEERELAERLAAGFAKRLTTSTDKPDDAAS
ncbi:hypothetical protein [Streptomyces sp. NBRC 109706]|uniref:hypothetical protein n=1 Tax=Streptomyces sp. NBRC 109706 TaxID=1550035 RepID=UPI00078575A3|nr:hypothetical protein [Streptomyces sp. NBRC 109706]